MMLYVVLTVKLRQIGSAESKSLEEAEEVDREPLARPGIALAGKERRLDIKAVC